MSVQRVSNSQLLTSVPIQNVVEAVWHAFSNFGLENVVIDSNRNQVSGYRGKSLSSHGKTFTASFEKRFEGVFISLSGVEHAYGTLDFGRGKKQLAHLSTLVMGQLENAALNPQNYSRPAELTKPYTPIAPIASPYGGPVAIPQKVQGQPVYGVGVIPKRGRSVLMHGILGIFCCIPVGPVAVFYGVKALREYKKDDPGDKVLVIAGMMLGGIGCLFMLLLFVSYLFRNVRPM